MVICESDGNTKHAYAKRRENYSVNVLSHKTIPNETDSEFSEMISPLICSSMPLKACLSSFYIIVALKLHCRMLVEQPPFYIIFELSNAKTLQSPSSESLGRASSITFQYSII